MSCFNPIEIKNKAVYWREKIDPHYMYVDCGQCDSCVKKRRDNYYVRARFEMMDCLGMDIHGNHIAPSGFILFPTLTFKPEKRPVLDLDTENGKFHIEGFSYKVIHRYLQELQDHFRDYYKLDKYEVGIRYMVNAEYGYAEHYIDSHKIRHVGQEAPHYHALLFFPHCAEKDRYYWTQYATFLWECKQANGWANYSRKYGPYVTMPEAIKYVTEYSTKQYNFYNKKEVQDYIYQDVPTAKGLRVHSDEAKAFIKARTQELKDILPNHYCSRFFGKSMVDYLAKLTPEEYKDIREHGVFFPDDYNVEGKLNRYPIPDYIIHYGDYVYSYGEYVDRDGRCFIKPLFRRTSDQFHQYWMATYDERRNKQIFDLQSFFHSFTMQQKYSGIALKLKYHGKTINDIKDVIQITQRITERYAANFIADYQNLRGVCFTPEIAKALCDRDPDTLYECTANILHSRQYEWKQYPDRVGMSVRYNHCRMDGFHIPELDDLLDIKRQLNNIDSRARIMNYQQIKKTKQKLTLHKQIS